jgi:hypothetical protein
VVLNINRVALFREENIFNHLLCSKKSKGEELDASSGNLLIYRINKEKKENIIFH